MEEVNNKQNERLVRLETNNDNTIKLLERIDSNMVTKAEFQQVIESFNNYKNTTKQYFDVKFEKQQNHLDDLCKRTKFLESIVKGDNIKDMILLYDKAKKTGLYIIVILGFTLLALIGKDKF